MNPFGATMEDHQPFPVNVYHLMALEANEFSEAPGQADDNALRMLWDWSLLEGLLFYWMQEFIQAERQDGQKLGLVLVSDLGKTCCGHIGHATTPPNAKICIKLRSLCKL